jgi:carbon starvation protein CstA
MTIPIAMLMGVYLRYPRPGKVLEGSLLGIALLLSAICRRRWVAGIPDWPRHVHAEDADARLARHDRLRLLAAALPVWLLLAPRDYLSSTFLKLGTSSLLADRHPDLAHADREDARITKFVDGSGPVFAGTLFPFLFITIACGAISGFHALVASGTTPKMLANEATRRMIGYGAHADGVLRGHHGVDRRLRWSRASTSR